jgi:hypothetical protein
MPYAFAVFGLAVLAFALRIAWMALRSPVRHRYWWAFVSTVCAPTISLDLNTGAISSHLFSFVILGVSWVQGGTGSLIDLGVPCGALLFLQRRRQLVAAAYPALSEEALEQFGPREDGRDG